MGIYNFTYTFTRDALMDTLFDIKFNKTNVPIDEQLLSFTKTEKIFSVFGAIQVDVRASGSKHSEWTLDVELEELQAQPGSDGKTVYAPTGRKKEKLTKEPIKCVANGDGIANHHQSYPNPLIP